MGFGILDRTHVVWRIIQFAMMIYWENARKNAAMLTTLVIKLILFLLYAMRMLDWLICGYVSSSRDKAEIGSTTTIWYKSYDNNISIFQQHGKYLLTGAR
mmetsp:Transcript_9385/g.21175  ORF Transcript_9385/g.21175 Transcript_9385/m.21175 type:complete len:100 (+) Transcript_9385:461-760(+)